MASDTSPKSCADVAVVILNWNGLDYLRQFLPGVLAHSAGATVFVADNASTDDSVAVLRAEFPAVRVLENGGNLGFCEGYNVALGRLGPEFRYYVLLNSDVEVTPGWLAPQRALLEANPRIAACQPKIRQYSPDPATRQLFEYAGAGGGYLDSLGYPFCRGRLFDTLETDTGQYDDARPVAWATGACLLVRAEAWHALSGLESTFFAHMEEIDFCWRLQNAGWQVWYQGGSTVFHMGGGTLHKSNPRKTYLNFRNGLALVYLNTHPAELPAVLIGRIALDGVAALRLLAQGQWADCKAVLRAHWHFWGRFGYWRQRRRKFPPRLRLSERAGTYAGSLVWAYFGQGKRKFPELDFEK
ncbi:dTDP-Rha--alpha-D-GlcNAc-pyrophosphate polyprenol alpha-3-L-rhamnosyltransferase [Hymenobacter amundsenii]|uniref:dTDP-Rha--alpha-D-GlcNAc-pyrophosphate polyprenol alpha-3-L-rhamnosyltransferase n=1 Tax=Hymenobacter amundsenii TaxID=2006685 RepID=A0A246FJ14_9BACT|nr:glycosyltransferase family 2 protein [Hymenobacter amundsenii]OWP62543.1 dTDP-Rha--alpha-D-GlcNAc-pyrophosphate polyprenol alpha-3-L-rhamnosyltransferase [Hymenobacter amundsenii]